MTEVRTDLLWELADTWEGRIKDKRGVGPIERYVWRKAWEELVARLGERKLP